MIRTAETDADLEAYIGVWNAITPDEPATVEQQRERRARDPDRLNVLAESTRRVLGAGFAGRSDSAGRGFLAPRVLPRARRRGVGTALLHRLADHLVDLGFSVASAHVDGRDLGSLAFANHFGFEEVDRQVEQVRMIGDEPPIEPPPGLEFVSIAERPALLPETYRLAVEGYEEMATRFAVTILRDDWLRDEATMPEGSFVALAGDEIVGYSGLCMKGESRIETEDGLTVVSRAWRRRGLATALKRAKLAWAAQNGVREITTWTQRGNDGMRAVNEQLGYRYRSVSVTVSGSLPVR